MAIKLNTTAIGDKFESTSLEIIKKMIEEGQLGHLSQYLKIYQQKEYFSSLRNGNIKFDLTIEVWPPNATRYSLIYIIECKDYEKRVPVEKIEEFIGKIKQVSGVNVKGIFISNSPLQKSGFAIAESLGMMVIEAESVDNYKIVLYKTNRDREEKKIPFIKGTFDVGLINEGVEHLEKLIDEAILSAIQENANESDVSYGIDRLSKDDIKCIAENELDKINPDILTRAHTLNIKHLIEYVENVLKMDIVSLGSNSNILGSCDTLKNIIGINKAIKGSKRELFILAHELGHYILHQNLSIGQKTYDAFDDAEYNFRTNKHDLKNPKNWIEWQANYFASSFVLPNKSFSYILLQEEARLNMAQGKIFLDEQKQNIKNYNDLVKRLAYRFDVSVTTVIFKLKEMDLIKDRSRLKSIGQVITEIKAEYFT